MHAGILFCQDTNTNTYYFREMQFNILRWLNVTGCQHHNSSNNYCQSVRIVSHVVTALLSAAMPMLHFSYMNMKSLYVCLV